MAPLNSVLQIGKTALLAHQLSMETAGNNIANVNTEGYSRRVASLRSLTGVLSPWGEIGRGVTVKTITRYRDSLIDEQVRDARSQLNEWAMNDAQLAGVDAIFSETEGAGFGARLDEFFNAWQDLANDPQSSAARANLRQKSLAMTDVFHDLAHSLQGQQRGLSGQVDSMVDEINGITRQIATLNDKILDLGDGSDAASTLLDERDRLLDQLSELVNTDVLHRSDGSVSVYINSQNVVDREAYDQLQTLTITDGATSHLEVVTAGGMTFLATGGKLGGLLQMANQTLPGYLERLNILARNLVETVNEAHGRGHGLNGATGIDFFDRTRTDAATMALSHEVETDLDNIAAGATAAAGDNAQALAIAGLKNANLSGLGTTLNDYYSSLLAGIGSDAAHALDTHRHLQIVHDQLDAQRESIQGVSLDEEMTNLMRFQHAYEAAARLVQTADAMMQTLLDMV